jgi:glucosylceramidase
VYNYCDAAVIADVSNAENDGGELYYHPQFYYLGHFSKWLRPGMARVDSQVSKKGDLDGDCSWPYGTCDGSTLQATAWKDEESGDVRVVVMNCGDDEKTMKLEVKGVDGVLENVVPAHGIQTYLL